MAKDFKALLRSLSQQLSQQEGRVIVACTELPDELKEKSPEVVLDHLVPDGKLSARSLEVVLDTMKEIGRSDLYKEVKAFKKKSRKMLSEEVPTATGSSENFQNFDVAESEAMQLRNTLQKMEGSDAIDGVKRIEEVYTEARDTAEHLVRLIRRANCLSRTLRAASAARQASARSSTSPPLNTSAAVCSEVPECSPPATGGLIGLLSRKKSKNAKTSKAKGKQNEIAASQNSQRKLNRSMSEKATSKITKQSSRGPSSLPVPPPPPDGSDSEDSLDYDLPDNPITRRGPVGVSQTMPRQVPQRQESHSVHQAIITSSSPRDTFTLPPKSRVQRPPLPPTCELSDDEDDLAYEDVVTTIFEMQNERKNSLGHSKPQSLPHGDGSRGQSRNEGSSTCSTPSSDLSTPPTTLPKPGSKGPTPAIPIRRASLPKSGPSSLPSSSLPSGSDTTPNQPMADIQQQLKENLRLKNMVGSPQGPVRVSPHPVSLAKALEMSNNQVLPADYNDSCSCTAGDSGIEEYIPVSTMWHKSAPPTRPKPKILKPTSPPQQSYANIGIIPIPSPTSPPTAPLHTTISQLAPIYTTHAPTPSPPNPGHTSVSAMSPMYNCVAIEEQQPEEDDDEVCPDYINIKNYVGAT